MKSLKYNFLEDFLLRLSLYRMSDQNLRPCASFGFKAIFHFCRNHLVEMNPVPMNPWIPMYETIISALEEGCY